MAKFEIIAGADIKSPGRGTQDSAAYDLYVAEDTVVPCYKRQLEKMRNFSTITSLIDLNSLERYTDAFQVRPTLVPLGVSCKLDEGTYLEVMLRSSTPLKYWLIQPNAPGIIDRDYYPNQIYLQLINLSSTDIILHKGDRIAQGIIKSYLITEDDSASGVRNGGFGSTGT